MEYDKDGTLRLTRLPNESADYIAKREELRIAEVELMRQRERVAELRRRLPQGAIVQDYVFEEGPANLDAGDTPIRKVRLSELFTGPESIARHLPLHVRKAEDQPVPDVHVMDRRFQRRRSSDRPERRLRRRGRRRPRHAASTCPGTRLGQPAAPQRWGQHVQIRLAAARIARGIRTRRCRCSLAAMTA